MNPHKICLILIIFLAFTAQGLRISHRFQQTAQGLSPQTENMVENNSGSSISTTQDQIQPESLNDPVSDTQNPKNLENESSVMVENDALIIMRSEDTTVSSEIESISLNRQDMENLIKAEYKKIREKFTFTEATLDLSDSDRAFYLAITSENGEAKVEDVVDFFDLSNKFNDINDLFTIETVKIQDFVCFYLVNEDLTEVTKKIWKTSLSTSSGIYKVEASKLKFQELFIIDIAYNSFEKSLQILSPELLNSTDTECKHWIIHAQPYQIIMNELSSQDLEGTNSIVIYSGLMDYASDSSVPTEDTEGMDTTQVPFYMYKTSKNIENYDKKNPGFKWFQSPNEGQMTLNLLLNTLDQTRSEETNDIMPPRGLSSVNYLGLKEATHYSESGKTVGTIHASFAVPDFSFLPIDQEATDNIGYVTYTNDTYTSVFIQGNFNFEPENSFSIFFNKYEDTNDYVISLIWSENSVLSFGDIKKYIFPTLTTNSEVN